MDEYYTESPQSLIMVLYDGCSFFFQSLLSAWWFLCLFAALSFLSHIVNHGGGIILMEKSVSNGKFVSPHLMAFLAGHRWAWYLPWLGSLMVTFFQYLLACFLLIFIHHHLAGDPMRLLRALKQLGRRFWHLIGLIMMVTLLVYAGFVLLVIPGLLLAVLLYMAKLLVLLDEVPCWRAIRESTQMVWGTGWWRTLVFFLLGIVTFASYLTLVFYLLRTFAVRGEAWVYGVYACTSVLSAMLTMLILCWQLALFHDLKSRWVMPRTAIAD